MMLFNRDSNPQDDLLNRRMFAEHIATGLVSAFGNDEDSFVFGLNGKWGSGKTTLMNYLKEALKTKLGEKKDHVIFDFNPWMFSGKDELLSIFLKQLSQVISPKNAAIKEVMTGLTEALSYFDWIKYINTSAGELQKAIKDRLDEWSSPPNIRELKEKIDQAIVDNKFRLFIFIDDLDRLTPQEVVEIFQIVKLNANFKNTIFIIAFDKEVVQEILTTHYGFHGERYLQKIIQVDYRIPDLLDETIESIFFETLQQFFQSIDTELDLDEMRGIWTVHRLKYYFSTLRDIHRYFNALKIRFPAIKEDVNVYQFLILEALRVFDFASYEIIQRHYKKGVQFGPRTYSSDIDKLIQDENAKVLYSFLFDTRGKGPILYSIADPQFFDRYFALAISKNDVAENMVLQFIRDETSRFYLIQKAIEDGKIKSLLARLSNVKIDLGALSSITSWPANSEHTFLQCRTEFIKAVAHIIESNGDFAHGLNFLVSTLQGNNSDFNPARFYLLFYFTSLEEGNLFLPYWEVIKSNDENFKEIELDVLKNHESSHLTFSRPSFKTDFFHKLFLMQYAKAHPAEYTNKLKNYFKSQENVLMFVSFLFLINGREEDGLDPYWVKALVNTEVLTELDLQIKDIKVQVLPSMHKRYYNLFLSHRVDIFKCNS